MVKRQEASRKVKMMTEVLLAPKKKLGTSNLYPREADG